MIYFAAGVIAVAALLPVPASVASSHLLRDHKEGTPDECHCGWEAFITGSGPAPSFHASGGLAGVCVWYESCVKLMECSGTYTITVTAASGTKLWSSDPAPLGSYVQFLDVPFVQDEDNPKFSCGGALRHEFVPIHDAATMASVGHALIGVTCHSCGD
jgi:hypothetical protein